MASEKPGPGLEPQPAGLIAVGAGGGGMGELRGAAGPGAVVLPAGMINPSVPIRNIRMKFAVLIGLIQVGEVSNRDIVETVLNLVRGPARAPRPRAPHPQPRGAPAARPRSPGAASRGCPAGDPPARGRAAPPRGLPASRAQCPSSRCSSFS